MAGWLANKRLVRRAPSSSSSRSHHAIQRASTAPHHTTPMYCVCMYVCMCVCACASHPPAAVPATSAALSVSTGLGRPVDHGRNARDGCWMRGCPTPDHSRAVLWCRSYTRCCTAHNKGTHSIPRPSSRAPTHSHTLTCVQSSPVLSALSSPDDLDQ